LMNSTLDSTGLRNLIVREEVGMVRNGD
jgi:hypothetical protein